MKSTDVIADTTRTNDLVGTAALSERASKTTGSAPRPRPAPERTTVYTPDDRLGKGVEAWRAMARELIDSRELTWRLYLRDFSARYRQSVLGYVWAIFPVLLTVVTFSWLNRANVLHIKGTVLPYPVFVMLGMTVWQLFASGLTGATQSLVNAGALITKINFPRETLVLAAFGQSIFEFVVRIVLVAAAFMLYRAVPAWTIVLVPLSLIPLCLFTLGLGFFTALVNGVMRDAGQLVTFLLTFWMFLTPVVYPAPAAGGHSLMSLLNPVSPFVIAVQDLATRGRLTQPAGYALGCTISIAVFLIGWRVFHLTETRIAERV